MKKLTITFLMLAGFGFGSEIQKKAYTTSPLSVYSGGIGVGSLYAINDELNDESQQFLNLAFKNRIHLTEQFDMTLDANWFVPGNNIGGDIGLDYKLGAGKVKPFLGLGVGAHFFGKGKESFGKGIGTSASLRGGIMVELSNSLNVSLSLPYYFVANDTRDQLVGINIGFLFSDGLKNIKKLNFN